MSRAADRLFNGTISLERYMPLAVFARPMGGPAEI